MSIQEIREMENGTILQEIANVEKELLHMRMGNAIGNVENPVKIRQKKRSIAQMKTVLRERALNLR